MKLMIEIDNSIYDICKSVRNLPLDENDTMSSLIIQSIANGTPLEKHDEEVIEETVESIWGKPSCVDAVSRQAVLEIFGYVMDYWKEHAIDVEPHEIENALIEQYEFTAKQLSDLPPVNPHNTEALDKIRAEIIDKSYLSYDDNPRHIIDESWVLEIIDKYKARK